MTDQDHQALLAADPTAFARSLLESLGVPARPLTPADGWSNHVWLSPGHVVRISSGRFRAAYAHEAGILRLLPATIPHARVLAAAHVGRRGWMVLERVAGRSLLHVWPALTRAQRREATVQLGAILRALHGVPLPAGFRNPWLDDALAPGGPIRDAYHIPPHRYRLLLEAAQPIPGVEKQILDEVGAFIDERLAVFTNEAAVLVHSDAHFANLLWHDGRLTALLDFEGAQPAAADLELDTLLRFTREPDLYHGPEESPGMTARDLVDLPRWLADAYPALFAHPHLTARLEVYEALWWLVQLQHFPPGTHRIDPLRHLRALLTSGNHWARL